MDISVHVVPKGARSARLLPPTRHADGGALGERPLAEIVLAGDGEGHARHRKRGRDGDGRIILATGNAVLYDESGKAIARNPGQTRFVIVFDANGTELSREIVKSSTGRSDDFCDAAVPALT